MHDDLGGTKILVVDDDFRNIFALSALLERANAEVLAAESGSEAIATLERVPDIAVVLMDIMMPGMDGYDTMRAIRALEQFRTLPMIAVTGKVMAGERQRCIDAGANDYASKPIDTSELLTAVKHLIPTGAPHRPLPAPAGPPSPASDATIVVPPAAVTAKGDAEVEYGPTQATEGASVEKAGGQRLGSTILVVDDDFRNTFALTALLGRGHTVLVAESGAEALDELEQVPDIDVVLMDIMMPEMDGYTAIRAIRAQERFADLPIIAVTARMDAGERQRCIDAGASDYVPKPVDSAELFAALRPWLPTAAQSTAA